MLMMYFFLACGTGVPSVLSDKEKLTVLLFLINCFQSLEEPMIRQVLGHGSTPHSCVISDRIVLSIRVDLCRWFCGLCRYNYGRRLLRAAARSS